MKSPNPPKTPHFGHREVVQVLLQDGGDHLLDLANDRGANFKCVTPNPRAEGFRGALSPDNPPPPSTRSPYRTQKTTDSTS